MARQSSHRAPRDQVRKLDPERGHKLADGRDAALERAKALALAMPVWPNPPVKWTPDHTRGDCGWEPDGTRRHGRAGDKRRGPHRPHERRLRDLGAAIFDEDPGDGEDENDNGGAAPRRPPISIARPAPVQQQTAAKMEAADGEFPLTLAAALAHEASQFSIGDKLVIEVGPPGPDGKRDGSAAKLAACSKYLAARGVHYAVESLKILRRVAHAFPVDRRRPLPWTFHFEAREPDRLDAIVASLALGEKLSAEFIQSEVRRLNGTAPRPSRARGVAGLIVRMIAALKKQPKHASGASKFRDQPQNATRGGIL